MRDQKLVYTVKEVAKLLGISVNSAYELMHRDDFPAIRVSERRIIVPCSALEAWLDNQSMGVTV